MSAQSLAEALARLKGTGLTGELPPYEPPTTYVTRPVYEKLHAAGLTDPKAWAGSSPNLKPYEPEPTLEELQAAAEAARFRHVCEYTPETQEAALAAYAAVARYHVRHNAMHLVGQLVTGLVGSPVMKTVHRHDGVTPRHDFVTGVRDAVTHSIPDPWGRSRLPEVYRAYLTESLRPGASAREVVEAIRRAMLVNPTVAALPEPPAADLDADAYGTREYLKVVAVPPCLRLERYNRRAERPALPEGYFCVMFRAAGVPMPAPFAKLAYEVPSAEA